MTYEFMLIDTKSAYYKQVVMLRHDLLRKPIGKSISEEDIEDDKNQYIIIAIDEEKVIGCILLKIVDKDSIKFRQMAIAEDYQRKGVGQNMISYAENFCQINNYLKIELNARKTAIEFYIKQGFVSTGNIFEEIGLPHQKMIKLFSDIKVV